ncbi:predicted protein [Scheffersomyces stipitis CBS 6054]|uniref:Pal1 cell morphology protein n=1 Tax=Scheffersomyces stipitis (strain ATCC 58785 / CBS 6054 / NBRC 10063 / NRRL Y-11545) TaxID=322104 RepID=A3GH93_PICST|nr:predicted protein [Scheffersomyces stipitis CBS 6054]EAZ63016.2 predicted protein [Scheffersomyces stipitis CBS 6054]
MASNNPFAAALSEPDPYAQRREPPPVPRQTNTNRTPPVRPPKPEALPSYEEAAGPDTARREYPREKSTSSSSRQHHSTSNRPHRSHSDSGRPPRSSRDKSSGTSETRHHSSNHKSSSHHSSSHHKSSSTRAKSPSKKKPEPVKAKNLDTIDKLDVTAFFGGGFHHDGPFDACTPHRNKNTKSAPVAAFPVDGPNNSIAGLAKTDKNEQMNLAFGTYTDDDQNEIIGRKGSIRRARATAKDDAPVVLKTNRSTHDQQSTLFTPKHNPSVINFDANLKAEPIHGSTTAGLGSTTFVDGAPAPKAAEMNEYLSTSNGGLSRKKSLVQRLRKNSYSENSSRRNSQDTVEPYESGRRGSLNNLETDESRSGGLGGGTSSLIRRVKSLKVRR